MMRARNWREVLIAVSRAGPAGVIRMASHATPRPRYPNPSPTTCSGDLVLIVLPSEAWPVPTPPARPAQPFQRFARISIAATQAPLPFGGAQQAKLGKRGPYKKREAANSN